jgi:hypothetical protein
MPPQVPENGIAVEYRIQLHYIEMIGVAAVVAGSKRRLLPDFGEGPVVKCGDLLTGMNPAILAR